MRNQENNMPIIDSPLGSLSIDKDTSPEEQGVLFDDITTPQAQDKAQEHSDQDTTAEGPDESQDDILTNNFESDPEIDTTDSLGYGNNSSDTRRWTTTQKLIASISGLLVTAGLGLGISKLIGNDSTEATPTPAPTKSEEVVNTEPADTPAEIEIPEIAKPFMEIYGDHYANPMATYYAEYAIETQQNYTSVLTDDFINSYDYPVFSSGEVSPIGFESMKFAFDTELTKKNFVDLFNEQAIPNLNLFMNLLARNPDSATRDIIKNEMKIYTSPADDSVVEGLMNTLEAVVDTYGSAAVFSASPLRAVEEYSRDANTVEFDPQIQSIDGDGNVLAFSQNINNGYEISVDVYESDGSMATYTELIPDFQPVFIYETVTGTRDTAPGYIAIGSR